MVSNVTIADEELAAVSAAALAAADDSRQTLHAEDLAYLDDAAAAAIVAALAASGLSMARSEPPVPAPNMAWRRMNRESPTRPQWR
jgi:hypothetical protein